MKALDDLSKPELIQIILDLRQRLSALEQEVASLKAKLAKANKDSSTSSKPPSSDIVTPPGKGGKRKRKIGGQPGHPKHDRPPFGPDAIDHTETYRLEHCPDCGGNVKPSRQDPRVLQQVDLPEKPIFVTEHVGLAFWCPHCRQVHHAPIPESVERAGLVGPRLSALVAYMKGACHTSYSTIHDFLRDVLGVPVSRGQLAKVVAKASAALATPYGELLGALPQQDHLNVDETGHKDRGQSHWTWCFRAELFTLFKIDPSRGSDVLLEVLGEEFDGILGCDYFSAYRKYMGDIDAQLQFCLAHLIRDVKFLTTLPDRVTRNYGERVLHELRALFRIIHRRDRMNPHRFARALERQRQRLLTIGKRNPARSEARNIANRFKKHGDAYFRFITTPGVEPTNNLAEQAIRFVVIDRRVTQGTRGATGQRWCERIWTIIATCVQQGRSVFEFIHESIQSHLAGTAAPSLMPSGP